MESKNHHETNYQIILAELPETIQNLINQAQKTGEPLTIVQNGVPFAIISPIQIYCVS
jgi:antitoxin VapB